MSGGNNVQFSEVRGSTQDSDPDCLYYNAMIINNSTNTTSTVNDPEIRYQDTRTTPILRDKSKYTLSVENFTINGAGKTLPIMIPQIQVEPNTNPNNTVYSITFTWKTSSDCYQSTRFIQWESENKASFTLSPPPVFKSPQINSDYYYCYSYTHWLKLMNAALACAWGDVQQAALTDMIIINTVCPFFTYDSTNNLFSLWQDSNTSLTPCGSSIGTASDSAGPSNPPTPYTIFGASSANNYFTGEYSFVGYNTNLEALITNFNTTYYSDYALITSSGKVLSSPLGTESCIAVTTTTGKVYYPENVVKITVTPNLLNPAGLQQSTPINLTSPFTSSTSAPTATYYVVVQDMESTSSLWSPVASIVLATTFLSVREEYSGTPITIGTGNLGGNISTGSFQKVLIEAPIEVAAQVSWRGLFFYEPKVETLTSLATSKEPLKNLDINIYWRNRLTNYLTPLTLYNGGSVTTRLMFKRI